MVNDKTRNRNFACLFYGSDVPNWKEIIEEWHVKAFVIEHDKDFDENGEIKPAHCHCMVMLDNQSTVGKVKKMFEQVKAKGNPVPLNSRSSYARYLTHMDNKDKYQYSADEVLEFGGADYQSVIKLTDNKYQTINEIIQYITEKKEYSFSRLMEYARTNNEQWFRTLVDSSVTVREYQKSMAYTDRKLYPKIGDVLADEPTH